MSFRIFEIRRALRVLLLIFVVLVSATLPGCDFGALDSPARFDHQIEWMEQGVWLKADTHIHSKFADGTQSINEIAARATRYGCNVIAITDNADRNLGAGSAAYLREIEDARQLHPGVKILAGLEWNVPPFNRTEQATVLFPPGEMEFLSLMDFKDRFDDYRLAEHKPELAVKALKWLEDARSATDLQPIIFYHHPSLNPSTENEIVQRMTDWQNVSDLVVGLSGAPGKQAGLNIGGYDSNNPTIDRWDPAVAKVGGAWDQLLQQKKNVWAARAPSDFQSHSVENGSDFWPGQFSETWLYSPDSTAAGAFKALAAGSFFGAHGHIVREVELSVEAPGLERPAYPGEAISAVPATTVTVNLKGLVPEKDWSGQANTIEAIELIVVTPEGTRVISKEIPFSNTFEFREQLIVHPAGMVVRARGRRKIADKPDLMFYTNPIRIDSLFVEIKDDDSRESFLQSPLGRALSGAVALCLVAIPLLLISKRRQRSGKGTAIHDSALESAFPQSRHFLCMGLSFIPVIVYFTLLPFDYEQQPWSQAQQQLNALNSVKSSAADRTEWMWQFIRFSVLGFLLMAVAETRNKAVRSLWALLTLTVCLLVGIALVFSKAWFPTLSQSSNEISYHSAGAFLGIVLCLGFGKSIVAGMREFELARTPNDLVRWLLKFYVIAFIVSSVLPLDFILQSSDFYQKFQSGQILLLPFENSQARFPLFFVHLFLVAPIGAFAVSLNTQPGSPPRTIPEACGIGFSILAGIELCQLGLYSRIFDSSDLVVGFIGLLVGAHGMRVFNSSGLTVLSNSLVQQGVQKHLQRVMWIGLYVIFLCFVLWWPFRIEMNSEIVIENIQGYFRLPFSLAEQTGFLNPASKFTLFIPLGILLAGMLSSYKLDQNQKKSMRRGAVLICLGFAIAIELVQALIHSGVPDISDTLLYSAGALVGMSLAARHTWLGSYSQANDST